MYLKWEESNIIRLSMIPIKDRSFFCDHAKDCYRKAALYWKTKYGKRHRYRAEYIGSYLFHKRKGI